MSQTYFAILTAIGEAKLANATALGTTLQLTQMGIGDGNGSTPLPNRSQTALVRENRRAPLNRLFVDPANASQIIAEQVIPEEMPLLVRVSASEWTEGGWTIDETVKLAHVLSEKGVDLMDCSSGGNIADAKMPLGPLYQVPFAEAVRKTGMKTQTGNPIQSNT